MGAARTYQMTRAIGTVGYLLWDGGWPGRGTCTFMGKLGPDWEGETDFPKTPGGGRQFFRPREESRL